MLRLKSINNNVKSFIVQPWCWIVERTFSWFVHSRRLSKDYEYTFDASENFIYVAMIRKMLKNMTKYI
ncbi:MAG: transposase [Candidatus Dojkabacteria bacterium]|nr:transposase [Candidatus Dojkabacteria bacterium]